MHGALACIPLEAEVHSAGMKDGEMCGEREREREREREGDR